jgi:DegV family protein with EDD domain
MSEKIAVISDTSCDLNDELVSKFNIKLIPFRILSDDGHDYRDRLDISASNVMELLEEHSLTTSLPAIQDITAVFDSVKAEGYDSAIVITISSGLSGTYGAIKIAAQNYRDLKIYVIDSKTLSMAMGFLVLDACEMVKNEIYFSDLVKEIEKRREFMKAYFILDTFKYLKKSGRMPNTALKLTESLNIKPTFVIKNGKISLESISLGKQRAIKGLEKHLQEGGVQKCAVAYTGTIKSALDFASHLSSILDLEVSTYHIGPALSLHGGKGIIGLIYASNQGGIYV